MDPVYRDSWIWPVVYRDSWICFEYPDKPIESQIVDFLNRPIYWCLGTKVVHVTNLTGRFAKPEFRVAENVPFDCMTAVACAVHLLVGVCFSAVVAISVLAVSLYLACSPPLREQMQQWAEEKAAMQAAVARAAAAKAAAEAARQQRMAEEAAAAERERQIAAFKEGICSAVSTVANGACTAVTYTAARAQRGVANIAHVGMQVGAKVGITPQVVLNTVVKEGVKAMVVQATVAAGGDPSDLAAGWKYEKFGNEVFGQDGS